MLATLAERPNPPAFPIGLDLDLPLDGASDAATGWPLLATPVSAGFPSPADDHVERRLSLDTHLIRSPESTFLMRAAGNDLAEDGIHDGDLLVVDRAAPPSTGSLVVAVIEGALVLRRVGRNHRGRRVLQSAHPEWPDRSFGAGQPVEVWGVVRWAIHRLWPGPVISS
ncbi:MAG: S24 family peptidase [Candidatus Competibacter sp.]|nr:translesion error-prone DNA polymerase V autoproteolytic subunit [Candidatus Competibacteraceae bacterium]HPE72921.1 S24 family peptidase [Candidatus Competibacter sp.]HRW66629.1 S24 family peptidase [Candidatus Competibacter sp.]